MSQNISPNEVCVCMTANLTCSIHSQVPYMFINHFEESSPGLGNINRVRKTLRVTPPQVGQRVRHELGLLPGLVCLRRWTLSTGLGRRHFTRCSGRRCSGRNHTYISWVSSTPAYVKREVALFYWRITEELSRSPFHWRFDLAEVRSCR